MSIGVRELCNLAVDLPPSSLLTISLCVSNARPVAAAYSLNKFLTSHIALCAFHLRFPIWRSA